MKIDRTTYACNIHPTQLSSPSSVAKITIQGRQDDENARTRYNVGKKRDANGGPRLILLDGLKSGSESSERARRVGEAEEVAAEK